jgi:hypothetical protein
MKKYSDKIKEYEDTDYMAGMKEDIQKGNVYNAVGSNVTRNDKIDTLKMPYRKLTTDDVYGMARSMPSTPELKEGQVIPSQYMINWDAEKSGKTPSVPQMSAPIAGMPSILKGKDLSVDYMQMSYDAAAAGDYALAKYYEQLHNEKNGYLDLGYANSHVFNYDDPYQGTLDRQKEAIENRDPFTYDYREDDLYKSIRAQKEKEAEKAYNDGYAQLSQQFDGDIPVNMINKLITTKSEIADQADSYIPQLKQMAYQMYQDEGNKMLTDYNLTKQLADEDYAKWKDDQNFAISGMENKYGRDKYNAEFDYGKERDAVGDSQWEKQFAEYARQYDIDAALRQNQFDWDKAYNQMLFDYQKSRDVSEDAKWQKEFDEMVRQFNAALYK